MRLTGTSSFLPDGCGGSPGPRTISSGTWRGDSSVRRLGADATARGRRRPSPPGRGRRTAAARPEPPPSSSRCTTRLSAHLGQRLDDGVELAGTEPDATPVQGGVGAAGDDARPSLGDGEPVAVAPHAREAVEVGVAVALSVVVAPEAHGHDGMGAVTTSSPCSPITGLPASSKASTRGARASRQLDLAGHDRHQRAAADEGGAHVGATADRREPTSGRPRRTPTRSPRRGSGAPVDPTERSADRSPTPRPGRARRCGTRQERSAEPRRRSRRSRPPGATGAQVGPTGVAVEQHDGGPDAADPRPGSSTSSSRSW